jgi:hypothetical protein
MGAGNFSSHIMFMKPMYQARTTASQSGASRPLVLAVIFFILGAALTGAWFHFKRSPAGPLRDELSGPTRDLLAHLATPVTLRFYSLLPAGSREDLRTFSGRVDNLLTAVQEAGAGKIQVTRLDAPAENNLAAATTDGLQAFDLDKGDACYLGLVISGGANKETMARLQPEWESALPYDLVRAILRVAAVPPPAPLPAAVAKPSSEIIASINRLIPDVSAVSAEQADQILHAEFVKQFGEVGAEMEALVNAAQQEMVQAQASGSPANVEAARKKLLQAQLAQGEKLKGIAADLQTRLAVFQQMKAGATK